MALSKTLLPRINKRIAKYKQGWLSGLSKTRKGISDVLIQSQPYGTYMCQQHETQLSGGILHAEAGWQLSRKLGM